jgi:hypothetical protein
MAHSRACQMMMRHATTDMSTTSVPDLAHPCMMHIVLFCFLPSIFIAAFLGQIRKLFSNRQSFCWCGFICICSFLSPAPSEVIFSSASLWVHEGTLRFAASLGSSPFCPLYSHAFLLGLCADGHAPWSRRLFVVDCEVSEVFSSFERAQWCPSCLMVILVVFSMVFMFCLRGSFDSRVFCDCAGRS